jgi:hypothetical protein
MKSGMLGVLVAMLIVALVYSIPTTISLVKKSPSPVEHTYIEVTPEDNGNAATDEDSDRPTTVETLQRTNLCI